MLFYRTDIFARKGLKPPTTFDDYIVAKLLKSGDMAGYVTRGKLGLDVLWEWTGFLLSYGGRFRRPGKTGLQLPEGIAATDMFIKLLPKQGPKAR